METRTTIDMALKIIGSEGLSGLECEASTLPGLLHHFGLGDTLTPERIAKVSAELHRQHLVKITKKKHGIKVQPTVKAIHRLQKSVINDIQIRPLAQWDRTWRMVTYDVPRAQSAQRIVFTRQLVRLGFTMVRESVWFHPQPCFEAVAEIVQYCGLQRHVTYAEVGRLDGNTVEKLRRAYPEIV